MFNTYKHRHTHTHIICIVYLDYTYVIICYYCTYTEKDYDVAVIIHFRETTIHQLPTTHGEYTSKKKNQDLTFTKYCL